VALSRTTENAIKGASKQRETGHKSLKLVIFDCDGTLVDSQDKICAAMRQAFETNGLSVPARERLLSVVGLSLPVAFARLAEGSVNGADHPIDRLVAAYRDAFAALHASPDDFEPLYPRAREAVEALARRIDTVLGMATGKSQRGVERVLGRHGLRACFTTIHTSDDAPSKPHPGMVLAAMAATGAAPHETIMIGDTTFDIEMAHAAGTRAIGVAWGYHPPAELVQAGADAMISDFAELVPTLERLWRTAPLAERLAAT
jgi:phosphoglycolate phosphatase